jgi:hypothetical protein
MLVSRYRSIEALYTDEAVAARPARFRAMRRR